MAGLAFIPSRTSDKPVHVRRSAEGYPKHLAARRVETTQKHYVVIDAANAGAAAMQQFEKAVWRSKLGQQVANNKTGSKNRASRKTRMDKG